MEHGSEWSAELTRPWHLCELNNYEECFDKMCRLRKTMILYVCARLSVTKEL